MEKLTENLRNNLKEIIKEEVRDVLNELNKPISLNNPYNTKPIVLIVNGIVYDIDKEFIYIVDMTIDNKWFYSTGEKYKLKHNFSQKEMNKIEAGTYISCSIKNNTNYLKTEKVKIKKSKRGHYCSQGSGFEKLEE